MKTDVTEEATHADLDDTAEGMDCVICGLSAEVETNAWFPVWADGGCRFVGMNCGGH